MSAHPRLLEFAIGDMAFDIDPMVRNSVSEALMGSLRYPRPERESDAVATIQAYYFAESAQEIPMDNVWLSPGCLAHSTQILGALLSPGDKIIAQFPNFLPLFEVVQAAGASVRWIDVSADLDSQVSAAIDSSVRGVYVVNPHNPTG